MNETIIKYAAIPLIPLVTFGLMRAFHKDPALFGIAAKPNSANATQQIPSRKALEDRARKCRNAVDITALSDKALNDLVWLCESRTNNGVSKNE